MAGQDDGEALDDQLVARQGFVPGRVAVLVDVGVVVLAAMEEDNISVRRLAKLVGVSPTVIQSMRSGIKKDFNMGSFFKILKGLGCTILIERNGNQFPLDLSRVAK